MPLKFRRAFFYFYVSIFLLLAPIVVLYTAGYRFNFRTLRVAHVGALSVTSIPKGASLFLDGSALNARTPVVAKRTLPGTYTLSLTHEGYSSWERQMEVKSRQTTVIDNIVLFLQSEPTIIQPLHPFMSTASNDGSLVAYLVESGPWLELWLYNLGGEQFTLLDRLNAKAGTHLSLHFSHDDYLLMLDDATTSKRRYYTQQGASDSVPQWFADYTFTSQDGAVVLQNANEVAIARLAEGDYVIDDVFDHLLLVRNNSRQQMLLIDTATSGPPILLSLSAAFARFDGNNRLYLSDGYELHRYDIKTNTDVLITRKSSAMRSVVPYPTGDTLFIVSDNTVAAMDVSDISRPVNTPLFSAEAVQSFWTDSHGKFGYAFATVNGVSGLYQIALAK